MRDTDHRETSTPTVPGPSVATQVSPRANTETPSRVEGDGGVPDAVLSNFAPLPSAHGVTYSLI